MNDLFQPIATLQGVGPATAEKLARVAGGPRILDLLFHMPEGYIDRRNRPTVKAALPGTVATLEVEVITTESPSIRGRPWRIICKDETGFMELVYFARPPSSSHPGKS